MSRKQKKYTLPVSDTVPGPGTYTAGVLNLYGKGLPVVDSTDLISNMGSGTAEDIASVLQAPVPGRDIKEKTLNKENGNDEQYPQ